jgi:hypothetical protein
MDWSFIVCDSRLPDIMAEGGKRIGVEALRETWAAMFAAAGFLVGPPGEPATTPEQARQQLEGLGVAVRYQDGECSIQMQNVRCTILRNCPPSSSTTLIVSIAAADHIDRAVQFLSGVCAHEKGGYGALHSASAVAYARKMLQS